MPRLALLSVLLLCCTQRSDLTVFAASSLKEPFEAIARDAPARLNFAGTQELRLQLEHGARADVFASADPAQMRALTDAGLVQGLRRLACNALVIAVQRGNPKGITSLESLARADRIVVAAPEVPAGRYTRAMFDTLDPDLAAAIEARVVSREFNVRQVMTKLLLGEADAGLVYRTDALTAGDRLERIELPDSPQVLYELAKVRSSERPEAAEAWISHAVLARPLLLQHGFVDCR